MDSPVCFRCGKKPSEIEEYQEIAVARLTDEPYDPAMVTAFEYEIQRITDNLHFIAVHEGTYNRETNTFACTDCYIEIGCPSAPGAGWKAPVRPEGFKPGQLIELPRAGDRYGR